MRQIKNGTCYSLPVSFQLQFSERRDVGGNSPKCDKGSCRYFESIKRRGKLCHSACWYSYTLFLVPICVCFFELEPLFIRPLNTKSLNNKCSNNVLIARKFRKQNQTLENTNASKISKTLLQSIKTKNTLQYYTTWGEALCSERVGKVLTPPPLKENLVYIK